MTGKIRFGTSIQPSFIEKIIYPFANKFHLMSKTGEDYFKRTMVQNTTNPVRKWFGNSLAGIAKNLLDHDYKETAPFANLGRIIVEPPMGAITFLLLGVTIGGRLVHASHRAVGGDKRELRDILCRDIPSLTLILYLLKPMVNWMSRGLEKWKGINLVQGSHVFGYTELEQIYRLESAHRLKSILANPKNHRGVEKAIEQAMANKHLSPTMKAMLTSFRDAIKRAMRLVPEGAQVGNSTVLKSLEKPSEEAFKIFTRLNAKHAAYLRSIGNGLELGNKGFVQSMLARFTTKIPAFTDMFATYAKNTRVWANAAGFALVTGILGIGIPVFNQWFTEREFKRLEAEKLQKAQSNPFHGVNIPQAAFRG